MDSWSTLSKTLKKAGLTDTQIKAIKEQLGKLDTTTLLKTSQDKLLAAIPIASEDEKQKILQLFIAANEEAKKTPTGTLFTLRLTDADASNSPPLSNTPVEVTLKKSSSPLFQGQTKNKTPYGRIKTEAIAVST
ncbi:MAG: hypothetical protein Q3M24_18080 [Candidatus Electrothrix aestuarii]|uniref:Uncharacterized protein n=1 Tax=Candidatus Electrothrix aestuarii TaxID=3062594 RepID=A0AAU8LSS5_9BACT